MSNSPAVISLCIISPDWETARRLVKDAEPYFDKIIVQLNKTPKPTTNKGKLEIYFKKWTKDFSEARNDVLKRVKTEYWAWFDTDDYVDFSKLPLLLEKIKKLDALYLPYDYAQDENGDTVALHWRERILRTSHPFVWKGVVHETPISNQAPRTDKTDIVTVHHDNPISKMEGSMVRNHELLLKGWEQDKDPRYAHYLGMSYFTQKEYDQAIEWFKTHIKHSGWDEESYRSMLRISDCYTMMDDFEKSVDSALMASKILPHYPDAYLKLAQAYFEKEEFKKCLEWLKVGKSKPVPDTLSIIDPTLYGYRTTMLAAMAHFQLGKFDTAFLLIQEVLQEAPNYKLAVDYLDLFEEQYLDWKVVQNVKALDVSIHDKKFSQKLFKALPERFQDDMRLFTLKKKAIPPKTWPEKSIVFFCGQTGEPWGPDTLEKGMGGSEEAITYLSRELRDLGYSVTVYNTRDESYNDDGVQYHPWYKFDYRDTYNTLVVWRMPILAKGLKAKRLFVDLHDVLSPEAPVQVMDIVDKFFVKTNYHKSLYPKIPENKFVVVGNGILPEQFKPIKKKKYDIGFFSAPNRGLETLLKMWPEIKKQVPKAKGIWNYGWQSYLAIEGENPEYHRIKKLLAESKDFTEGGRISHTELAKVMGQTRVWAYPTEFPEIHCITALKAQESGMWPVSTHVAALKETLQDGDIIDVQDIYTNEKAQKEFIDKVVDALKNPKKPKPMVGVSWKDVAKVWAKNIT